MLVELQVKNLALIENVHVEFGKGLNILTGETGAGKSIIIGSINLALGAKMSKSIIRNGAEYAYIELIFQVEEADKLQALQECEIPIIEDHMIIISKKIMPTRSVSKINDETVTAAKLKEITSLLLDIHGQHEHQSLLHKSKHLEILDEYAKAKTHSLKQNIAERYHRYMTLHNVLFHDAGDEESRRREADFLRFEIEEIEQARLQEGEEEKLMLTYRKYANAQKIMEGLSVVAEAVNDDAISRALREMNRIVSYDEALIGIQDQLSDVDAILSDLNHEVSHYMAEASFDDSEFSKMEARLDLIHGLQAKYGNTMNLIEIKLNEKKLKLEELEHFDEVRQKAEAEFKEVSHNLETLCEQLSVMRQSAAKKLTVKIKEALTDLNFIDVVFQMDFKRLEHYRADGYDEAEFLISTNLGQSAKPLGMVASGGELSRIMLAIKTVLADSDDIPTLIFDEIDTGISGRTAQKVSEKLQYIARTHQVICITHLPQIAAMADTHFEIAKHILEGETKTTIEKLDESQMIIELARLLGGAKITDTVLKNAKEMKELAEHTKHKPDC